ncbi:ricin-type beta-trefoil lectin domain protein [Micromonospora sp. M12]
MKALDRRSAKAGRDIYGWRVDVMSNRVVVLAETAARRPPGHSPETAASLSTPSRSSSPRGATALYDIRGGDQYVINGNTLCSVGFAVVGGFVSAGHCGGTGSPTLGYNNVSQGSFAGSSFPGNDYAWIRTNSSWTPQPWVNNYSGGNVTVAGSQDAAIGSSVCRSGRTTGWRCGTILGRDETINYAQGAVSGLSRSNACAEGATRAARGSPGTRRRGHLGWDRQLQLGRHDVVPAGQRDSQRVRAQPGHQWRWRWRSTRLISNWNNKCIDVPGLNFSDGVPLQTWSCNGTAAQAWTFTGGTLRAQNNKCMDVNGGSTANGATIQLWSCNGTGAQQFVLSAAGDLVNPQANKCVDIDGWNGNDGARLVLWDCAGTANQKWHVG